MSNLSAVVLPQVVKAINEYGVEVTVYRDIYENVIGVRTLVEEKREVAKIKIVIDNSNTSSTNNARYTKDGIISPQGSATLYYAFDSEVNLIKDDYIIIDNLVYILGVPSNLLHYNILYQVTAEVTTYGE